MRFGLDDRTRGALLKRAAGCVLFVVGFVFLFALVLLCVRLTALYFV